MTYNQDITDSEGSAGGDQGGAPAVLHAAAVQQGPGPGPGRDHAVGAPPRAGVWERGREREGE